tara:strand:- start:1045 stop:1392 length:348 start_codon:yes stop_codon:yes gene_type:complete
MLETPANGCATKGIPPPVKVPEPDDLPPEDFDSPGTAKGFIGFSGFLVDGFLLGLLGLIAATFKAFLGAAGLPAPPVDGLPGPCEDGVPLLPENTPPTALLTSDGLEELLTTLLA